MNSSHEVKTNVKKLREDNELGEKALVLKDLEKLRVLALCIVQKPCLKERGLVRFKKEIGRGLGMRWLCLQSGFLGVRLSSRRVSRCGFWAVSAYFDEV
jgi:hypothetical protein